MNRCLARLPLAAVTPVTAVSAMTPMTAMTAKFTPLSGDDEDDDLEETLAGDDEMTTWKKHSTAMTR